MRQTPIDLRTADGMLSFVDGCEDRQVWVSIGMALKSEFGDDAFNIWHGWSQNAANYSAAACRSSWKGFKSHSAGGYTIGTLVKLAKDGGYNFDKSDAPVIDQAELARRRAERSARIAAEQADRAKLAHCAETSAMALWRSGLRHARSAYAERKGLQDPESCRYLSEEQGGGLLVPMLRYDLPRDQSLKGIQTIREDGVKRFTHGMIKPGTACRLGLSVVGDPVFICEGYATGMSLRMAMARRFAVYVAFDAYSLPLVVDAVYQANPQNPIVICADDDHATTIKGIAHNTGRIQAQVALDGVMDGPKGAKLVVRTYPVFKKDTPRAPKDTDFNDLHRLEGLGEVAAQLELSLEIIQTLKTYG